MIPNIHQQSFMKIINQVFVFHYLSNHSSNHSFIIYVNCSTSFLQLRQSDEGRYDILDHLYEKFDKAKVAKLCKELATGRNTILA